MLVVNPAYTSVTEAWFDPAYWSEAAQQVSLGGRGGAWFIDSEQGEMVLRQYRRGGLAARISDHHYIYTGWQNTRSFREFELLQTLRDRGLPVPEPVAARASRKRLWYEAAILIRRIPGAVPLPNVSNLTDESLWSEVGRTIRRFHDAGLDHVDLNCDNILVAATGVYLIDLDRCLLRSGASMQRRSSLNLKRLRRSLDKRLNDVTENKRTALWGMLLSGYNCVP